MPQISYRANLSAAEFPMTIAESGRTVIVPGPDNNYDRRLDPSGEQKDAGIPQALFLENVIPTQRGYQSVGYIDSAKTVPVPAGKYIADFCEIWVSANIRIPLIQYSDASITSGKYGITPVAYTGITAPKVFGFIPGIQAATVAGVNYIFYWQDDGFGGAVRALATVAYNSSTEVVTLSYVAETPALFFFSDSIKSVTFAANYLIAASSTAIYWSSTTTPTDFTTSLVTGAGQENPNGCKGKIICVRPVANGFYIYCENNTVIAEYTGNFRYPFRFTPVADSTGVKDPYFQVSGDWTSASQFIIESNNQVKIYEGRQCAPIASPVSSFLTHTTVVDSFDYATNTFSVISKRSIVPRIYLFKNRYALISVNGRGRTLNDYLDATVGFTHLIIYDSVLRRYGRLKLNHSYIFTVTNLTESQTEALAFIDPSTNKIYILHFDIYESDTLPAGMTYVPQTGVFVLGKLQYVRSRLLTLELIDIEGPQDSAIEATPNFEVIVLPSLNGKSFDAPVTPTLVDSGAGLAQYATHTTAKNHSLLIKGAFSLSTIETTFIPGGNY